jgi:hypothetical protein
VYHTNKRLKFGLETVEQKQLGRLTCKWDSSGSGKGPAVCNLNIVMDLQVPQKTRYFFTTRVTTCFSRRTQFHGIWMFEVLHWVHIYTHTAFKYNSLYFHTAREAPLFKVQSFAKSEAIFQTHPICCLSFNMTILMILQKFPA